VLIPSIDLLGGRIVQLEQGERLVITSDDFDGWIARFARYPVVQIIDLDAAKGTGDNDALVRRLCRALPCQVGGGIRSVDRAQALLDAGAVRVIVGSALFRDGRADAASARGFADAIGRDRLVAAIDSRGGRVAVRGWTETTPVTPLAAIEALDEVVGGFLYTHVDTEGLLGGFDLELAAALRAAATTRLIVAGGIRSQTEIDALDRLGIDAVVGMAIYRGLIPA
jgi:phosphoribosylformimino-5-aminoimidazole carboxamide ribotide isomerase